jgi:hypothetical protein
VPRVFQKVTSTSLHISPASSANWRISQRISPATDRSCSAAIAVSALYRSGGSFTLKWHSRCVGSSASDKGVAPADRTAISSSQGLNGQVTEVSGPFYPEKMASESYTGRGGRRRSPRRPDLRIRKPPGRRGGGSLPLGTPGSPRRTGGAPPINYCFWETQERRQLRRQMQLEWWCQSQPPS